MFHQLHLECASDCRELFEQAGFLNLCHNHGFVVAYPLASDRKELSVLYICNKHKLFTANMFEQSTSFDTCFCFKPFFTNFKEIDYASVVGYKRRCCG